MKQLNTRRAKMLKTEKIAVLNEGGTVDELRQILKEAFPKDIDANGSTTFYIKLSSVSWQGSTILPYGYTAHPISWFFEADEAVKPTFEEMKSMSLEERIEALKKMGYVDGVAYKAFTFEETFVLDSSRSGFGDILNNGIDGGIEGGYLLYYSKWAEIISKPDEAPQPEAEIIGWELMIDVPEVKIKATKSYTKIENSDVWYFVKFSLPESILRDMKSARPIYKRTTEDILNAVKQGTMTVEDAVKELEQTKTA